MSMGGSQPANTTNTQTTELPEWARPYAKNILSEAQGLTDVNRNPYESYDKPRNAGFSPLQIQSFQGAANMQPSQQLNTGSGLAGAAGFGSLNLAEQSNPQDFQKNVMGYMNPYMNQILAPQLAEANRNYDISATRQQGAATQAGAFGGSREAIMAAENERNRNTGLNQIYGQGLNTGFTNAQNQYNQNAGYQLQALQNANQAAGQLGNLGQLQYGQNMGINQLQNQYGGQMQNLQQQGLSQAYQDFLDRKNYAYKNIGYMSDILRGTPTGSSSVTNMYQGNPNYAGQIIGTGIGAYGALKADGGQVHEYADGGSIDSASNIQSIISKLTDEQLEQALQAASSRQDVEEVQLIQQEIAHRTSMRQGMGSIPINADEMASDENPESITGYKDGGETEKATSTFGDIMDATGITDLGKTIAGRTSNLYKAYEATPGFFEKLTPSMREARRQKASEYFHAPLSEAAEKDEEQNRLNKIYQQQKAVAPATVQTEKKPETKTEAKTDVKPPKPAKINSITDALQGGSQEFVGPQPESIEDQQKRIAKELRAEFSKDDEATNKGLNEAIEKQAGESKRIREDSIKDALMNFGFNMAAAASKPGARFTSSIGEAAPSFAQSLMESKKLAKAADDNYTKMKMDQLRYQGALNKNNTTEALSAARSIQQGKLLQQQIADAKNHYDQMYAVQLQQVKNSAAHLNQGTSIQQVARELAAQPENRGKTMTDMMNQAAGLIGGAGIRSETAINQAVLTATTNALKGDTNYTMMQTRLMSAKDPATQQKIQADIDNYYNRVATRIKKQITGAAPEVSQAPTANSNITVLGPEK